MSPSHPRLLVVLASLSAPALVASWEQAASACSCAGRSTSVLSPPFAEGGRPIGVETPMLLGNYFKDTFTLTPSDQFVDEPSEFPDPGTDIPVAEGVDESDPSGTQDAGASADASAAEPTETGDGTQATSVVYRRTMPVEGSWGLCGPIQTAFYAPEAPLQPGVSYSVRLDANTLETFIASEKAAPLATADDVQFFVFSEHWAGTNYNVDVFVQTTPGTSALVTAVGDHTKMVRLAEGDPTHGLALGDGACADLVAYALDGSVIASERRCEYDATYDRSGETTFVSTDCDINATGRTWAFWQAVMAGKPTPSPGVAGTESVDDSPAPDDTFAEDGTPASDDTAGEGAMTNADDAEPTEVELQAVAETPNDETGCAVRSIGTKGSRRAADWWPLLGLLALPRVRNSLRRARRRARVGS